MTWAAAATLLGAAVVGVGTPWLFMRMLGPSLASSPAARAVNFRGREVHYGLGIVWLVWAGCALVGGAAASALAGGGVAGPLLVLAGPLALVAFALGAVDDAYGTGESRGFKGHLRAMARGRLTTGGLKLVGIGLACLAVAAVLGGVAPWGDGVGTVVRYGTALIAGAAIALTSNFVNLADLRPGRALKVYVLLSLAAVASVVALVLHRAGSATGATAPALGVEAATLAIFLAGPVLAVWRDDLGERGMLGDAGANPMGAVAGMLIVAGLPVGGLVAYFGLVFALNLASERVSFSRVIDRVRVLSWLDGLGRSSGETLGAPSAESDAHDVRPPI